MIRLQSIWIVLCVALILGCAQTYPKVSPSYPKIRSFERAFGKPHIIKEGVHYYFGGWHPDTMLLKFRVRGDTLVFLESEYVSHPDLYVYVPLLIESLKDTDINGTGWRALQLLSSIMKMDFPNGYGAYYMHPTKDGWTGTPLEPRKVGGRIERLRLTQNTYVDWKKWWESDLSGYFYYYYPNTDKERNHVR